MKYHFTDELLSLSLVENSLVFVNPAFIKRLESFSDSFLNRQAFLLKHWLVEADVKVARIRAADARTFARAIAHMRVLQKVLLAVLEERRFAIVKKLVRSSE